MATTTTRDKILAAGLKLFSHKGYLGSTTREIAREAGVAEVTLFRYFPSKDKLFEAVIGRYSFLTELRNILPELSKKEYPELLCIIAERFLNTLDARKDLVRIMLVEVNSYPETITKIYHSLLDELYGTLARYFSEQQKKGILREFDPKLAARAFLGMFFAYFNAQTFLMHSKYKQTDPAQVIREFVSVFVHGTLSEKRKGAAHA